MWKKILKVLMATMLSGYLFYFNNVDAEASQQGVIIIGDSRTLYLSQNCDFEDVFFVAKGGEGYDFFVQEAIQSVEVIMSSNPQYTKWNIVSNMGYNDLAKADDFIAMYKKMMDDNWKDCNFYILSLMPVNDAQIKKYFIGDPALAGDDFLEAWGSRYTSEVLAYNEKMKESEFSYIDIYDDVNEKFTPTDGIHYQTYEANHFILEETLKRIQYDQYYEETSKIITDPYTLHTADEIAESLDQVYTPVSDEIPNEISAEVSENVVE